MNNDCVSDILSDYKACSRTSYNNIGIGPYKPLKYYNTFFKPVGRVFEYCNFIFS